MLASACITLSSRLAGVSGLRARALPVGAAALRVRVVGVRMMSATAGKVTSETTALSWSNLTRVRWS
jgi:hypothetical protein